MKAYVGASVRSYWHTGNSEYSAKKWEGEKGTLYAIQVSWNRRWISWPLLSVTTEKARWLPGPNDPWEANMPIPKATALAEDLPTCPANPAVNITGPIPISSCVLSTLSPSSQHRHYFNAEFLKQQRMQITSATVLKTNKRFLYVSPVGTFRNLEPSVAQKSWEIWFSSDNRSWQGA